MLKVKVRDAVFSIPRQTLVDHGLACLTCVEQADYRRQPCATKCVSGSHWRPRGAYILSPAEQYLSKAQYGAALALAAAHGHLWAELCADWEPEFPVAVKEIEARSYRAELRQKAEGTFIVGGILAPYFDGRWIIHTTATGRTTWQVDPAGNVEIRVARPQGEVLLAEVHPDGWTRIIRVHSVPCHERHVAALADCIRALLPSWEPPTGVFGDVLPDEEVA